jgi:hypothetical protein
MYSLALSSVIGLIIGAVMSVDGGRVLGHVFLEEVRDYLLDSRRILTREVWANVFVSVVVE